MRESRREVLVHGVIAGVIGYATVVLFFSLLSMAGGRSPFEIPSAMGSALLLGGAENGVGVEAGAVLAFNGVHMLLSLGVGLVVAWLLYEAERHYQLWYVVTLLLIGGFIIALLAMGVLGSELARAVSWSSVLVANILWAITMGGYLYQYHRGLGQEIEQEQRAAAG
jgi:hypothetical protein